MPLISKAAACTLKKWEYRVRVLAKMKPSGVQQLLRPWNKFRTREPFYGFTKSGNERWSLSTKQGNKEFYKGTQSTGVGRHTKKGKYQVNWEKVRTFVVPAHLEQCDLKPLVDPTTPNIKNHYQGYDGATDPKLQMKKIMEFVEYGYEESPEQQREEGWKERG